MTERKPRSENMIQSFLRSVFCGEVDVADSNGADMSTLTKYRDIPVKPTHEYFRGKCTEFGDKQAVVSSDDLRVHNARGLTKAQCK